MLFGYHDSSTASRCSGIVKRFNCIAKKNLNSFQNIKQVFYNLMLWYVLGIFWKLDHNYAPRPNGRLIILKSLVVMEGSVVL